MGIETDFECVLCETKFDVDVYDSKGINKCPTCGQVYNYKEDIMMDLDIEQIEALKKLKQGT